MMTKCVLFSARQANRSKEAISLRHGPHQLAHTLMIRGLPRNVLKRREGPFKPCSVASRNRPPIGTSSREFAHADFAMTKQSKKASRRDSDRLTKLVLFAVCPELKLSFRRVLDDSVLLLGINAAARPPYHPPSGHAYAIWLRLSALPHGRAPTSVQSSEKKKSGFCV